jgi:hypothetical protein
MMSLENQYQLKRTADPKACFICGKSSEYVFDASDDFFYTCLNHVKDSAFCCPVEEAEKFLYYRLHRSILYLREKRWEERRRWSLIKKLQ